MKRKVFSLVLILLFMAVLCVPVGAQEAGKTLPDLIIEDIPLSEEEKENYANNFCLRVFEYDPEQYETLWIHCIDVSQSERIALVFSNDTVVVADKDFQEPVVLRFVASDPPYSINWNGDHLEIISNRSARAYTVSSNGEVTNVSGKVHGQELSSASHRTSDTVNGNTYQLKRSNAAMFFSGGYDKLVRTDSSGKEQLLFQSAETMPVEDIIDTVLPLVGILGFVVFIIVSTLHLRKKRIHAAKESRSD